MYDPVFTTIFHSSSLIRCKFVFHHPSPAIQPNIVKLTSFGTDKENDDAVVIEMASLAEEIPVGLHGKLDAVSDPAGKLEEEEEENPRMSEKLPDSKDSKISEGFSTKGSFLNYNEMLKKILAIDDIHGAFDITSGNGVSPGLSDNEALSKNGITALLPAIHLKMEESERRFGNGDQTWNNLQIGSTGKSPSFDFGVPFDAAKASGFDQTPLLHPFRKTPVRSLSINDFQDRIIQTRYGRNSVDYDAKSEAPFLNNNENNGSDKFEEKTRKESFGSDVDWEERKLKGNGKAKGRHSFFSACICCIASTE